LALAYKDLKQGEGGDKHEDRTGDSKIYQVEEDGLVLICMVGIKDIIRPEVPDAVVACNRAGVRVRMVTGDNKITAIAIAKECGIIQPDEEQQPDWDYVCMEGPYFCDKVGGLKYKSKVVDDKKDSKTFGEVVYQKGDTVTVQGKFGKYETIGNPAEMKIVREKLKVLARSRPQDKYIMVAGLKEFGDIVAVTGDGTNDAPAMKKADVGFAMRTGTNVAHNASDIIIEDDNFSSII
jgi:Ca2+ transporting ATPase